MKEIITLLFIFILNFNSKAQISIGALNVGSVSNNINPYSIGEIFVIGSNEKENSSGILGVISSLIKTDIGVISVIQTDFFIYPNPSNNEIRVKYSNINLNDNIGIYDLNGKLVLMSKINEQNPIDISILPIGNYILKIKSKSMKFTKK